MERQPVFIRDKGAYTYCINVPSHVIRLAVWATLAIPVAVVAVLVLAAARLA